MEGRPLIEPNATISVEFGTPIQGDNPVTIIRIYDRASRELVVSFGVTQSQLTRLIRGAHLIDLPAFLVDRRRGNLHHPLAIRTDDIPKDVARHKHDQAAAVEWAEARAADDEETSVTLHSYGWSATYHRWVER